MFVLSVLAMCICSFISVRCLFCLFRPCVFVLSKASDVVLSVLAMCICFRFVLSLPCCFPNVYTYPHSLISFLIHHLQHLYFFTKFYALLSFVFFLSPPWYCLWVWITPFWYCLHVNWPLHWTMMMSFGLSFGLLIINPMLNLHTLHAAHYSDFFHLKRIHFVRNLREITLTVWAYHIQYTYHERM